MSTCIIGIRNSSFRQKIRDGEALRPLNVLTVTVSICEEIHGHQKLVESNLWHHSTTAVKC